MARGRADQMAGRQTLKPEQVVEALKATGGLVFLAAERLGVSVRSVYRYRERYACVAEAAEHEKGKRLDLAEASLWKAVLAGEGWAVCFYLKTQGKHRGYVERHEVDGAVPVRLEVVEEIVWAEPREAPAGRNGESSDRPGLPR